MSLTTAALAVYMAPIMFMFAETALSQPYSSVQSVRPRTSAGRLRPQPPRASSVLSPPRASCGFSLLELLASLALVSAIGLASAAAFVPLARSIEISAAKSSLLLFLTDARRRAYGSDSRIDLVREKDLIRMNSGDRLVRTFRLPAQISISRWPRRKTLRFYPSGLADNATVGLSAHGAKATVVVNHRGMVR